MRLWDANVSTYRLGFLLREDVDNLRGEIRGAAGCGLDELREEVEPKGLGEADGGRERDVPPPPEIGNVHSKIRTGKVSSQTNPAEFPDANRHIGVEGHVRKEDQRVSRDGQLPRRCVNHIAYRHEDMEA